MIVIFADHFEVPSSTLCFTVFICWACVILLSQNTSLIKSKISGLFRSRIFMRSFMAMMKFWVRSSAPCFELFSAAPVHQKVHNAHQKHSNTKPCFTKSGRQGESHELTLHMMALVTDCYSQTLSPHPPFQQTHKRTWTTHCWERTMGVPRFLCNLGPGCSSGIAEFKRGYKTSVIYSIYEIFLSAAPQHHERAEVQMGLHNQAFMLVFVTRLPIQHRVTA